MRRTPTSREVSIALAALALVAVVSCSSNGTASGGAAATSDTLVVRLKGEVGRDPRTVRYAAEAIPHVLEIDESRVTATSDGTALELSVTGVTDAEAEQILERLTNPKQILVRPVVSCTPSPSDGTVPTAPAADPEITQEMPSSDGSQWCIVGPTSAGGGVFDSDAEAVNDPTRGWLVKVSLSSESRVLNDVVRECFEQTTVCPSGQLALGLGSELIMVASVQAPSFQAGLEILGTFTEEEVESIAADLRAYSAFWGFTVESTEIVAE